MQKLILLLVSAITAIALALPVPAEARSGGHRSSSGSHSSYRVRSSDGGHSRSYRNSGSHARRGSSGAKHLRSGSHKSTTSGIARDRHGRIKRSTSAKNQFKSSHACPSTGKSRGACPGYVIDHVKALKHGGADAPSNMQWQTKEAAKAKDKWE